VQNNNTLNTLSLPALLSVGGGLQVQNNAALGTLSLSALETIGGGLTISTNEKLVAVELNGLRSIGTEGTPVDDFRFDTNATTAASTARIRIDLPIAEPVRLFGKVRIFSNRRIDDPAARALLPAFAADAVEEIGFNQIAD
jgi:hypothetical protein